MILSVGQNGVILLIVGVGVFAEDGVKNCEINFRNF